MQTQPSLFARDDTFLGVCEALGEDFGFNPLYLRLALAALLLWNPLVVMIGYLGAGLLVAASRWAFPKPVEAKASSRLTVHAGDNDTNASELAMAA